jgi:hypothetical protein
MNQQSTDVQIVNTGICQVERRKAMAKSRRKHHTRNIVTAWIGFLGFVFVLMVAKAVANDWGWILASMAFCIVSFAGGMAMPMRIGAKPKRNIIAVNTKYGKVIEMDAVSAYPPEVKNSAIVRKEVSSALQNLGWAKATTGDAITNGIQIVKDSGQNVTTARVVQAILKDAGLKSKDMKRIDP